MTENPPRSRRRSAASSSTGRPETPVFFIEYSLGGKRLAETLRDLGVTVEVHTDHFPGNAKDTDWLTEAGRRGWAVITRDERIRYRTLEREALINAGVGAFVLAGGGKMSIGEMGRTLTKALDAMITLWARQPRPFVARLGRGGEVSLLIPTGDRH